MGINFKSALGLQEASMRLRSERASVLSSNLANMDTPNFKARDINFQEALNERISGTSTRTLNKTQVNHMGFDAGGAGSAERYYRTPSQPSIDGNTVEENTEHAEFMKNSLEFQVAFTLLNSKFKGLTKAIKGE